jgi:hypothetical protein
MKNKHSIEFARRFVRLHLETIEARVAPSATAILGDAPSSIPSAGVARGVEHAPVQLGFAMDEQRDTAHQIDLGIELTIGIASNQPAPIVIEFWSLVIRNGSGEISNVDFGGDRLPNDEVLTVNLNPADETGALLPADSSPPTGDITSLDSTLGETKALTRETLHAADGPNAPSPLEVDRQHAIRDMSKIDTPQMQALPVAASVNRPSAIEMRSTAAPITGTNAIAENSSTAGAAASSQSPLVTENRMLARSEPPRRIATPSDVDADSPAANDVPVLPGPPSENSATRDVGRDVLKWTPPSISASDVVSQFKPFDSQAIEQSIDRFLDRLHADREGSLFPLSTRRALMLGLGLASGLLVAELARRSHLPRRAIRLLRLSRSAGRAKR